MRRLFLPLALLAVPAFADEKSKPNTLTPKEIADGWVLLFDGETTFGWKVDGSAELREGVMVLGGDQKTTAKLTTPFAVGTLKYAYGDGTKWGTQLKTRDIIGNITGRMPNPAIGQTRHWINEHGVGFEVPTGQRLHVHSIMFRPSNMTDLFSGNDLSGWKLYDLAKAKAADPKAKDVKVTSKSTVTKDGWLNVKDGPGDLQTEGQWADFVLQLDCISNGKHLNSGVFFRCIPDLYQQGYEAQIRNQWEGDDRTKPVDFGTGAIYRRKAARKVVSTDGEWFTMTVAAHGRHIATWVNGYQVVDWTDDRKESDNARQGFKKGKGAISIQGHDPTTDLSFRNIRLQSLDK